MRVVRRYGLPGVPLVPYSCTALLVGSTTLFVLEALTGFSGLTLLVTLAALIVAGAMIERIVSDAARRSPTRVAVIGGPEIAERLQTELERLSGRMTLVGRIALPSEHANGADPLGRLDELRETVIAHDIQLLVLGGTAPRLRVFDELVERCLDLPVRLIELPAFYEAVFGFVPLSEMNAVWFQYLLDPSSRLPAPFAKRAIDLFGAALLAVPVLPLCGVLVLLIRRDGGAGIYRQERIGEGGRRFTLYKLRTMRPSTDTEARWAEVDDQRVTGIGRWLRSAHVDELPQLLNVLRGEMSLVGPRPEQPAVVERLERDVRFYQRRHLIRPGLTGWAQIRCGYARSESGSMWKHCHDLYYLKHRSTRFDLWILAVTSWLVVLGALRRHESVVRPQVSLETLMAPDPVGADSGLLIASRNPPLGGT